jgi:hypothetical protein
MPWIQLARELQSEFQLLPQPYFSKPQNGKKAGICSCCACIIYLIKLFLRLLLLFPEYIINCYFLNIYVIFQNVVSCWEQSSIKNWWAKHLLLNSTLSQNSWSFLFIFHRLSDKALHIPTTLFLVCSLFIWQYWGLNLRTWPGTPTGGMPPAHSFVPLKLP